MPEVLAIHLDPACHRQLKEIEQYILEEFNVNSLLLAEDDSKYGVKLEAESDNDRLGKRLKRDFKTVTPVIKSNLVMVNVSL